MLRHVATVAVVATLATGCTKRQQDFAWFATAVALEVAAHANEQSQAERPLVVVADPDAARGPTQADLDRAYRVAMELTLAAAHEARTGNCDAAVRSSKHVRVIDPAVFANVFLRDPAIQSCLALAPPPAPAAPTSLGFH
jgi:hypothetical protein